MLFLGLLFCATWYKFLSATPKKSQKKKISSLNFKEILLLIRYDLKMYPFSTRVNSFICTWNMFLVYLGPACILDVQFIM